jgi:predicted lipoprotein
LVDDFERKEMLENLSDNYILPGYQTYLNNIVSLEQNMLDFENNPSLANYNNVLMAYENSASTWQTISFLEFGPAENIALRSQSNLYPIDSTLIQQNILDGGYNLGIASNFLAKGWQSLDYLLYMNNDTVSVTYLNNNPTSLLYIQDVIADLKSNAEYVNNAWQTYKSDFINNSSTNANGSAVSDMTNALIAHYETYIRKGKVGLPAGVFNGFSQTPMPQNVENLYQHIKLQSATSVMTYFRKFLNGQHYYGSQDGLGLLDYANFVGAISDGKELSIAVNTQIDKILIANEYPTMPWAELVQQNTVLSNEIYLEYQKLIPLIKVDLTSALGIIITYQDNDGD